MFVRLTDSVERLLRTVETTPGDRLDVLLRLLQQRKSWIESELAVERMLDDQTLPPFDLFPLEFLLEPDTQSESDYVRLLDRLDQAIFRVQNKIAALNLEARTSDS